MGSVGDAYDNAMAESFFATLECELLEHRRFKTQAEAPMALFAFIEGFYNPRRRRSALGYLSPVAFERRHAIMAQKHSTSSPGQPNHAAVLAPIKHKPSRARKTRVLDRDCARRQSLRMGRDEGTGSAACQMSSYRVDVGLCDAALIELTCDTFVGVRRKVEQMKCAPKPHER
jgi:hypothetical protein